MSIKLSRRKLLVGGGAMLAAHRFPLVWAKSTQTRLPIPTLVDGTQGAPIDLKIQRGA